MGSAVEEAGTLAEDAEGEEGEEAGAGVVETLLARPTISPPRHRGNGRKPAREAERTTTVETSEQERWLGEGSRGRRNSTEKTTPNEGFRPCCSMCRVAACVVLGKECDDGVLSGIPKQPNLNQPCSWVHRAVR